MCDAIRHRGPDDWGVLRRERHRPGDAPAQHHRHGRRSPADDQRGRQRRGWSSTARSTTTASSAPELRGPGAPLPHPLRHRGRWSISTRSTARPCVASCAGCSPSRSGTGAAGGCCSARDHFGQKPLFYTEARGRLDLRLRDQGAAGRRPEPGASCPRARSISTSPFDSSQPPDTFFAAHPRPAAGALPGAARTGARESSATGSSPTGPSGVKARRTLLERIDALLDETVAAHLLSDVPVGAFLSGGLDSTLVASYAARRTGNASCAPSPWASRTAT